MIDGKEIKLGEEVMTVPALSLKQIRTLLPRIKTMKLGSLEDEDLDTCIEIIRSALSRNYPNITKDDVENMVDMRNMVPVTQAVMNLSGLESAPAGGAIAGNQ